METTAAASRLMLGLAFAAVWIVWGSTYLAIAVAIETLPPLVMAGVRFVVAGVLVLGFVRLRGAVWPSRRQWRSAAIVGALMLLGGNGLVTWAEQTVPSSIAALLITTVPLWMTLLEGSVYGGRKPGPRAWIGLALGFLGVAVLVRPQPEDVAAWPLLGSLALITAAFSWANGSLLSRRLDLPSSPMVAVGAEMLAGGALMALIGIARGELVGFDVGAVSARSMSAWLYLVAFGSIMAFSAYMFLLRHVSATAVSTYAFVNPMVAVLLGWWLADEPVTLRVLGAGGLIVVAVVVILLRPSRRRMVSVADAPGGLDGDQRQVHAEA